MHGNHASQNKAGESQSVQGHITRGTCRKMGLGGGESTLKALGIFIRRL